MAKFVVLRVRTDKPGDHRHVSALAVEDVLGRRFVVSREDVAKQLRSRGGHRYYDEVEGIRTKVRVIVCPRCKGDDYLTSYPTKLKVNHLLRLRKF